MRIIINADDMGRSEDVNQAVIGLHQKGVVSSTTLMANASHFTEAVDLLKRHPELGCGVHLCLDGPYNSASDYQTLIDSETMSFYGNKEVVKKIRSSSFDKDEVFREFGLQIEKVQDQGIKISHLDTHHNLHLYFPILKQVIRVARKYGLSYIRSQRLDTCIPKGTVNKMYRNIHQLYLNKSLKSVSSYYDPAMQDCIDFESNLTRLKRSLDSTKSVIEIMVHPVGGKDPETSFFSSPEVQELLSEHQIINYNHL